MELAMELGGELAMELGGEQAVGLAEGQVMERLDVMGQYIRIACRY